MELTDVTKAFANGDLARPNLFEIEIPFLGRDIKFKCKAGTMPAAVTEAVIVGYQNKKIKLGGDRTFEDWTITVYNDTDHDVRQQFLDWQNTVHALDRQIYGDNPDVYKKEAQVSQLNRQGEKTATHTIYGAWPTNVGEIALDWDTNNEVETFEVTLSVDWWI
ncbi:tail tube protein [Citrobacter phage Ci1]|nr:tail tube protein [Citrobacter phage Ci1]